MSIATPLAERVTLGKIVLLGTMFLKMPPISPTGCAHLAVLEHIPRLPTKIHAPLGRIAPPAIASLPTEPITPTVPVHPAEPEHIPPAPTHSPAPLGPIA